MRSMPVLPALALSAATIAAACAPPVHGGAASAAPALYVLGGDAAASAVTIVDPSTGRVLAPAIPAGQPALQLAAGPGGSVLALSSPPDQPITLAQLRRSNVPARPGNTWDA